jgi:hypothetical protein
VAISMPFYQTSVIYVHSKSKKKKKALLYAASFFLCAFSSFPVARSWLGW